MKPTKDNVFLDTNTLVYLITTKESAKGLRMIAIMEQYTPIISTQVLQELANVLIKKQNLDPNRVKEILEAYQNVCTLHTNTYQTIKKALDIKEKYRFSFYDSLILAAAQETNCRFVFSEDMQNQTEIAENMTVVNPFLEFRY